jgi:hypothetical protein
MWVGLVWVESMKRRKGANEKKGWKRNINENVMESRKGKEGRKSVRRKKTEKEEEKWKR